jgi:hypothetical protein
VLVALDRALGTGDLLDERRALFGKLRAVGFAAGGGLRDRVADEASVPVEAAPRDSRPKPTPEWDALPL